MRAGAGAAAGGTAGVAKGQGGTARVAVPHSGGKTRRRGEALESALLDAAWDELQAVGYTGLTIEAEIGRAHV